MEILAILISLATLATVVVLFLKLRSAPKIDDNANLMLQQQMNASVQQINQQLNQTTQSLSATVQQLNAQVSQNLQQTNKTLGDRLDNAARVVGEVNKRLGSLEEVNRQVYEVGKDIASLQEILRAPKLRGSLGELFLGDLLSQILPPEHYESQHRFKSGDAVDAVIKLGPRFVPVDSKFPLENFKRVVESASDAERAQARKRFNADVKKHVDAIHDKYIRPDEGTYDFALMYIPAENVYYETIIKDESAAGDRPLFSYALEQRVIPVSPNSFYAYLQTILLGLKGMQVEQRAQEILATLQRLRGDFEKVQENFRVLGKHITNAANTYAETDKSLNRFDDKLTLVEKSPVQEASRIEGTKL